MTDLAFRARMRQSWRFDHAYLLDQREAAKAALKAYIIGLARADAFERHVADEDIDAIVARHIEDIEESRSTPVRADVLEWLQ